MAIERLANQVKHEAISLVSYAVLRVLSHGITLEGKENLPRRGPAIVVNNHMGILEVLPPHIYLPDTPVTFTKVENLEIPVFSCLPKFLSAIPVHRGEVDRRAIYAAIDVLKKYGILYTCPEGTRGRDKDRNRTVLKPAKPGIIYIAQHAANVLKTSIPIYPMAVWGTEGVLPQIDDTTIPVSKRLLIHRDNVHVSVGEPVFIHNSRDYSTPEARQSKIDEVMLKIRDMLPKKYHGYYA